MLFGGPTDSFGLTKKEGSNAAANEHHLETFGDVVSSYCFELRELFYIADALIRYN